MEVCEMNSKQTTFKFEMNDNTERIIIAFRKKSIFGADRIIASTVIKTKDIQIFKEYLNNEHQKITIYEPIQNKNNSNKMFENKNRAIVGKMDFEFTMTEEFIDTFFGCVFSKIDPKMYHQSNGLKDFFFQDHTLN